MPEAQSTQTADWNRMWSELGDEGADPAAELNTLRFHVQEKLLTEAFGGIQGLDVIEIGAGRATNALLYAMRGARATVLDSSPVALEQARRRFEARGLTVTTLESDVFALPDDVRGRFDVSMSFGLCEHFAGERRSRVIAAHLQLLKPGGIAMVNVPNRWSPLYRLWMGLAKRRGTWTLGYEVPFSGRELVRLARDSGGVPMRPMYLGGLGTLINHGPNAVLHRLGRRPLPVPQIQIRLLDYLAYDLLIPIVRAGAGRA